MLASHKCVYCRKTLPTLKGLCSHLTQRKICHDAIHCFTEKQSPTKKPSKDENEDSEMTDIQDDLGTMDNAEPMLFKHPQEQDSNLPDPSSLTRNQLPDRRPQVEVVEDKESGTHRQWL